MSNLPFEDDIRLKGKPDTRHKWRKLQGNAISECVKCNDIQSKTSYGQYYITPDHQVRSKAGECKGELNEKRYK